MFPCVVSHSSIQLRAFYENIVPKMKVLQTKNTPYHLVRKRSVVVKALCYKPEGRGYETR
jgi:hypothetical protein